MKKEAALNGKIKKRSQLAAIWMRYKKSKLAIFGLILFGILLFFAFCAPIFANYDIDVIGMNMNDKFCAPLENGHLLGADQYGRDVFGRIVYGGRYSLFLGIGTVGVAVAIGALIGSTAGYFGGIIDNVIMRTMDIFLALPQTLLAVAIVAALGPGMQNLLIAIVVADIPWFARVVRSSVLSIRGQDFIEAAKSCGTSSRRIIIRHILPNAIGPIIVQATLEIGIAIMSIAALSFIGLGIQAPTPEWGAMLSEGKEFMLYHPGLVIFPGVAIILSVMSLNLIGDGLRDALDPRMKN